jgi:hypothetical protein
MTGVKEREPVNIKYLEIRKTRGVLRVEEK